MCVFSFANCLASVLACHLLNQPNCDRSPMQTAQKTERQTMKAFSVGVAWPAYFIKTHDRQQTGGGREMAIQSLSSSQLTLFAFHYLFSYRRTIKISCHTHTHTLVGSEK